ncbi:hypothetical protein [Bacteroides acidifaciens]|uniref:hypothetical protein n=1 Tax=Bacteroides acidifaciens TaxID=85831 RepID=UPI002593469A|nr:hypothetical protein [Bacteroides acidifaciens]
MTSYDTLLVLARLILPVELLDCFDIVEIENDAEMLTIPDFITFLKFSHEPAL